MPYFRIRGIDVAMGPGDNASGRLGKEASANNGIYGAERGKIRLCTSARGSSGCDYFKGRKTSFFLDGVITTNIWPAGRQPFFQRAATRAKSEHKRELTEKLELNREVRERRAKREFRRKSDNANIMLGRTVSPGTFNRF